MKLGIPKSLKSVLLALVLLLLLDIAFVLGVGKLHGKPSKSDAIVVLGAAVYTPAVGQRSLTGLDLYKAGLANEIVLSGGEDKRGEISEAGYMQDVVDKNKGEFEPKVLLEENSHTTFENIHNVENIIGSDKSIIIVSDEFHLARAYLLAKRGGFSRVSLASPNPTYYRKSELMFYYAREVLAMFDYVPKFILNKAIVN